MKDKILIFIIGFLVGAIVASTGFFIFDRISINNQYKNNNRMEFRQMNDGETPPQKPNDESDENTRPELPPENNQLKDNDKTTNNNK